MQGVVRTAQCTALTVCVRSETAVINVLSVKLFIELIDYRTPVRNGFNLRIII